MTAEHAIAWAQLPQGVDPVTWLHRLTAVRSFATWLRTTDPAAEIPPRGVFPGQGKRPAPFIYTRDDITRLVAACGSLRPADAGRDLYRPVRADRGHRDPYR